MSAAKSQMNSTDRKTSGTTIDLKGIGYLNKQLVDRPLIP
jgi:hypothetical protein